MTDLHTMATRIAKPMARSAPRPAFYFACRYCGGNIAVESGSPSNDVRCPSCSRLVRVLQSDLCGCKGHGRQYRADPAGKSRVSTPGYRRRSGAVAPVVAALGSGRRVRRHMRPRIGTHAPIVLLTAAILILYMLFRFSGGWLGLSGSAGPDAYARPAIALCGQ
jgi:ribosomal protein S27E